MVGGNLRLLAPAALTLALFSTASCKAETTFPDPSPTAVNTPAGNSRFTSATVVDVIDGASIDVEIGGHVFRVRYLGIEIPEDAPGSQDGQPLSQRALQFNRHLVEDETVELEKGDVDADDSGRLLRYVYANGEMVNEALLINGYATVASYPPDFQLRTSFAILEESARKDQRGLWASPSQAIDREKATASPTPVQPFRGGTLPKPPEKETSATRCDYSTTSQPVIKGNINRQTGEHIYHVPGDFFYSTTVVSEEERDRWFCTEKEAEAAGWKKSKR